MKQWRIKQEAGVALYRVRRRRWWFPFWVNDKLYQSLEAARRHVLMKGKKVYLYYEVEDRSLPVTGEVGRG